jgi:hypothetical protein
MWYKLVENSNRDLFVVAFNGSTPEWKTVVFGFGGSTSLERLREVVSLLDGPVYWDKSYIDDNDLSEIPEFDTDDAFDELPAVTPSIDMVRDSPNQSARGSTLSHLILHNTSGSFSSAVSWLCNPQAQASAHLVISRRGQTAQLVQFSKKAWHAGNSRYNANSIGIEIEATDKQRGMTLEQEKKVIQWVRYLMGKYEIPLDNVIIHRWVRNTDCPVFIWETDEQFKEWREKHLR